MTNPALFEAMAAWYPGWSFALCCFAADADARSTPMVWWYPPLDPDVLFLPAVDSHDGGVPDLGRPVRRDHVLVAGSDRLPPGSGRRRAAGPIDERPVEGVGLSVGALIRREVVGSWLVGPDGADRPNGDFVVPVASIRAGRATFEVRPPPGLVQRPPA